MHCSTRRYGAQTSSSPVFIAPPASASVAPGTVPEHRSSSSFTGALSTKKRSDLVEIANALELPYTDVKVSDLVKKIQDYLALNEGTLGQSPMFKGLYGRRRA